MSATQTDSPTQVKRSNVLDVRAKGAKCDNSTNDKAAIQEALDAAGNNGGGTVFIPAGTCRVDSSLSVPANTRLAGAGFMGGTPGGTSGTSFISFRSSSTNCISFGGSNAEVRDLVLSQDSGITATSNCNAISASSVMVGRIQNVRISSFYVGVKAINLSEFYANTVFVSNCVSDGWYLQGAQGCIENPTSLNNGGNGFKLVLGTYYSPIRFDGVHSYRNSGWDVYATCPFQIQSGYLNNSVLGGVYVKGVGTADGYIANCRIEFCGQPDGVVVPADSAPAVFIDTDTVGFGVLNCHIFNANGIGIHDKGTSTLVHGGSIQGCGTGGVSNNTDAVRVVTGACTVSDVPVLNGTVYVAGPKTIVRSSRISADAAALVRFASGALHCIFDGNVLFNVTGGNPALQVDVGASLLQGNNAIVSGTRVMNGTQSTIDVANF